MKTADINKKINPVRMYKDLSVLASFGPRNPGTPGDRASLDYLISFAKTESIKVHRANCEILKFIPQSCNLQVLSPFTGEFKCVPQDRTCSGPEGGITGEILYVGCGYEKDYENVNAKGKLLLMEMQGLHLIKKVIIAAKNGASGCILIHPYPGNVYSAWGLGESPSPVPVVSITYEDGQLFQKTLKSGKCSICLNCNVINEPTVSEHVIMELPAKYNEAQETIILIAHRDTTHISPGANDNASGMAVLLELIRVFKNHPLDYSLLFIFSTAEEGGGIGISQLLRKHSENTTYRALAVINLDMLAVGSKLRIIKGDKHRHTDAQLNNMLKEAGAGLNYHLDDYESDIGLADIEPFIVKGIPSSWLSKPDDRHIHTEYDLPEYVNPNDLKVAADIVANTLLNYKTK